MASIWQELKRRNVVRVGIGYAIVAWLIVQVVVSIEEPLNLPSWTDTLVIILLAIGFVVALILAWAYELTPQGVKRTKTVPLSESISGFTGRKLDFAIIALLVIAVGYMFVDNYIADDSDPTDVAPSIAVLPFVDMSPDGDQEYFGDGIAEELLNELVRLDGLRVAGRTSSFSFKGTNANHETIANALNVATILEGSVRKDGDRIRITAQLINAADGYHLWSETYDRELSNIFEVQEEIAISVTGALGVRLGVGSVNAFHGAGTSNVEAYEAYLRAMATPGDERLRQLEQVTRIDPNYSAAWSHLGLFTAGKTWRSNPEEAPALTERAYEYVQRAVELDPESAQSTSLLGSVLYGRKEWLEGEAMHRRAIELNANFSTLSQYGHLLMRAGRSAAALQQYELAEAAEPVVGPEGLLVYVAIAQDRLADARKALAWAPPDRVAERELMILLHERDADRIAAWIEALPPTEIPRNALYSPLLDVLDVPEDAVSMLEEVYADDSRRWPSKLHDIALLAAYFGDADLALQTIGEEVRYVTARQGALWFPIMTEVRKLPGFKTLVRDLRLVEYWRASGWADLCRPLGDDDFECF